MPACARARALIPTHNLVTHAATMAANDLCQLMSTLAVCSNISATGAAPTEALGAYGTDFALIRQIIAAADSPTVRPRA